MSITILTSLFPSRIEQQQKALKSWLELGFKVVSLNLSDEANEIKPLFHDVLFLPIDRPIDDKIGSRIYLNEIFDAINSLTGSVFGIVNSDIVFKAEKHFQAFIENHTKESMVFGSRIDVADWSKPELFEENPHGFDYFFFRRNLLDGYYKTDLCLGMPFWDYWLPLLVEASGHSLKRLISPVAMHYIHEEIWSENHLDYYWLIMIKSVRDWLQQNDAETLLDVNLLPFLSNNWRLCSDLIQNYLKYETASIFLSDTTETQHFINIHKSSYLQIKNDLLTIRDRYNKLECDLRSMKNSRSWRITEPLRSINMKLQEISFKAKL